MLLHCVGIEAMRIFNGMKFGEGEDRNKMADILVKYDQHFLGQKQEFFERFQFNRRTQESGESIVGYVSVLRNMAKTCGFCDCMRELLLMDRLLLGILDDKAREGLLSRSKGKSGDHGKGKHGVKDNPAKGKSGETSDPRAT